MSALPQKRNRQRHQNEGPEILYGDLDNSLLQTYKKNVLIAEIDGSIM